MPKGQYQRSPETLSKLRYRLSSLPKGGADNPNWRGGKSSHPLYLIYYDMVGRCNRPSHLRYADYGGRGIQVDPRWVADFWQFVADVGERPEGKTPGGRAYWQLDRINNDGNYEPGNVRWASPTEQACNTRPRTRVSVCRRGHEMTEENTAWHSNGTQRRCRECCRINEYNRTRSRERRGEI